MTWPHCERSMEWPHYERLMAWPHECCRWRTLLLPIHPINLFLLRRPNSVLTVLNADPNSLSVLVGGGGGVGVVTTTPSRTSTPTVVPVLSSPTNVTASSDTAPMGLYTQVLPVYVPSDFSRRRPSLSVRPGGGGGWCCYLVPLAHLRLHCLCLSLWGGMVLWPGPPRAPPTPPFFPVCPWNKTQPADSNPNVLRRILGHHCENTRDSDLQSAS